MASGGGRIDYRKTEFGLSKRFLPETAAGGMCRARFTRERSLVQSQVRPLVEAIYEPGRRLLHGVGVADEQRLGEDAQRRPGVRHSVERRGGEPGAASGSGQFKSSNGFAFTGTFTLPAGVNSVELLVKEIGSWANGSGSSNGTNQESSITVSRPTSGCAPPPPQCPTGANAPVISSSDIGIVGDSGTVSFTVAAGCSNIKLSLVSYKAPGPAFDEKTADQQTVHDSKTVLLGAGNHTLTVAVPNCYYQVDFVYGDVIAKLGPAGSSNFYSAQGRLIKARNGGTASCTPPPTDQCPNIQGNQASVPAGMIKDANGNCVTPPPPHPPPTDECPNIEGNQASVPAAMVKDSSSNCFTPSTPAAPTAL